jgi:hypothetical protein
MQQGGMGPVPPGAMPTAMLDNLRPSPDWPSSGMPPGGPRGPRRLMPVIAAAAVVLAAVIGFVAFHGHPAKKAASSGSTPAATSSAASQASQRDAAARLSALLAQSVTARGDVIDAVVAVRACRPSLPADAQIFAKAASSRERLLSKLRSLPGRSALPAAMLRDLGGAWQASAQADTDLAHWTNTKIARGCHAKGSDASLQASYGPDGQATTDKKAFAGLWDPIANQYGLTAYQWDQL